MWAGRAVSARRLKNLALPLAPGGSSLLAWTDEDLGPHALDAFEGPGSRQLVVRFEPTVHGAVLAM
jgi:hypothetical protein